MVLRLRDAIAGSLCVSSVECSFAYIDNAVATQHAGQFGRMPIESEVTEEYG